MQHHENRIADPVGPVPVRWAMTGSLQHWLGSSALFSCRNRYDQGMPDLCHAPLFLAAFACHPFLEFDPLPGGNSQ
jgi:hypothetical protein